MNRLVIHDVMGTQNSAKGSPAPPPDQKTMIDYPGNNTMILTLPTGSTGPSTVTLTQNSAGMTASQTASYATGTRMTKYRFDGYQVTATHPRANLAQAPSRPIAPPANPALVADLKAGLNVEQDEEDAEA